MGGRRRPGGLAHQFGIRHGRFLRLPRRSGNGGGNATERRARAVGVRAVRGHLCFDGSGSDGRRNRNVPAGGSGNLRPGARRRHAGNPLRRAARGGQGGPGGRPGGQDRRAGQAGRDEVGRAFERAESVVPRRGHLRGRPAGHRRRHGPGAGGRAGAGGGRSAGDFGAGRRGADDLRRGARPAGLLRSGDGQLVCPRQRLSDFAGPGRRDAAARPGRGVRCQRFPGAGPFRAGSLPVRQRLDQTRRLLLLGLRDQRRDQRDLAAQLPAGSGRPDRRRGLENPADGVVEHDQRAGPPGGNPLQRHAGGVCCLRRAGCGRDRSRDPAGRGRERRE